ncbi:hypothetical protein QT979_17265 [Microcoleus sp. w2-18bC1]|uniref:hypothetical protein n=1 Tax=unclassified Microcoleus TaxID=2642155 RepID=UPI002FD2891C
MNTEPTIDRRDIKAKWGLNKVSDVTNARKALGQPDWQNSLLNPDDRAEIDLYFELVLNQRIAPGLALKQVVGTRNGRGEYCNDIDSEAIASDQKRDAEEEKSGAIQAIEGMTREASLGMADVAGAVSDQILDAFKISLSANLTHGLTDMASNIRSNFSVLTEAVKAAPLDLRNANLPAPKPVLPTKPVPPRRISPGLW